MYFQSFGAVSIVKVNAAWFHVRERGTFGGIFGVLISLGLYLAFAIPIYYRWKMGDAFQQGSWNLGTKWKWMAPIAVAEIAVTSVIAILPGNLYAYPGANGFGWKYVNYAPIVLGVALQLAFLRPLRDEEREELSLLVTWAIALGIEGVLSTLMAPYSTRSKPVSSSTLSA